VFIRIWRPRMIAAYEQDHGNSFDPIACDGRRRLEPPAWLVQDTVAGPLGIALFDFVHQSGELSTYIGPMGGKVQSFCSFVVQRWL
jgi:hypothetical protein